jgi:chromosome segregation ATPase
MQLWSKQSRDELVEQIAGLRGDIKALKAEREAVTEQLDLTAEITGLKEQISDLEVDESRIKEAHARERREVEHQVGLQRKRQDFEVEAAKRDTELTVREENLHAERERFDRDMDFQRKELQSQIGYLKDLMERLFERLPSISLEGALVGSNGHRNGD